MKAAQESNSWSRVYDYDAYGNRWVQSANHTLSFATPTAASQFDAATNRLTNAGNGDELPSDAYDDAGNLAKHPWVGAMVYDANSLQARFCTGITQPCTDQSAAARYEYDGDGRRVKKHLSATHTIVFVYDAFGNLAAEYDTEPASNLLAGTYYRTTDHLGSTRLMTDATAKVVSRHDYFPFGEEIPANSGHGNRQLVTDANPTTTTYNQDFGVYQKFTGKERDGESGLDYFGARYFSAIQGRFTSPDPLLNSGKPDDPQSWSRYQYVGNNPLRFTDPLGLYQWDTNCDESRDNACKDQRNRFRAALDNLKQAAANLKERSKERKDLEAVIERIGEENKGRVKIAFGDAGQDASGKPNPGGIDGNTITLNWNAVDQLASQFGASLGYNSQQQADLTNNFDVGFVAHEGGHISASKLPVLSNKPRSERIALYTQSVAYQGLRYTDVAYKLWNQSWAKVDVATREDFRNTAIQTELARQRKKKP